MLKHKANIALLDALMGGIIVRNPDFARIRSFQTSNQPQQGGLARPLLKTYINL